MAAFVYILCALTALTCAVLLLRAYAASRAPLLMWSGLCFTGLTINNVLLILDRLVYTHTDLTEVRLATALASVVLLLVGLIWESD
jgi:hypothetical protein